MPRKQHEPTDRLRQSVLMHAMVGTPHDAIGKIIGVDAKTLRKHYREQLDLGLYQANAAIGGALYNKAKGGDTAAMIFWLKTRAGFREVNRTELANPDGSNLEMPTRLIFEGVKPGGGDEHG